ncbi:C6 transcription factor-like protein [Boeremia exigua]|uniref:C6 transcription factor-like protein n=1 Tax=Boeremia exigua TaxID=749465 RepID=UPI001E8DCE4A|nr:C6 transcription factor-like protein [Boeremia exigua]KAH6637698.1 C6 transcription factor-like protein [Boeremia exigua]
MSSQRSSSMEAQDNIRKRVCKACDRCRLKKSKCDGASPCSRCKADNAICVFGERKKSQDKVYPKGYVEMLEQQQTQLVAGLRELYTRLQSGQGWPGQPLREAQGGHPLTHDILERLDLLHGPSENGSNYEGFEEDCSRMQHKLLERGAPLSRRRGSVSSDSEPGHTSSPSSYSGTPTTRQFPFTDPFARNNAPPTPPMNSPFPNQPQMVAPMKQESPMVSSTFMQTGALDPSALSRAWMTDSMMMDEPMDFSKSLSGFDNFNNSFDQIMMGDPIYLNPNDPMMPDWNNTTDLDFNNFIQNPVGA